MKTILPLAFVTALTTFSPGTAEAADTRCYEMRIYYAAPGKLDALNSRFRDHTCKLFEKHGMVNIGYWLPLTNTDNKLVYLLAYPSREAREKSWKAFGADPDWQSAYKASEKDGKLVTKADSIFLAATDFSPAISPSAATEALIIIPSATVPGTTTIDVFAQNNVAHNQYAVNFLLNTGLEETGMDKLSVYPNPTSGIIFIRGAAHAVISLVSASGITLRQVKDFTGDRIDLRGMAKGVYMLKLEIPGKAVVCRKIVVTGNK